MKNLLGCILLLSSIAPLFAQRPAGKGGVRDVSGSRSYSELPKIGTVTGLVNDSITGEPVPFATVSLFWARKDSLVGGASTDEKGYFKIIDVRPGPYYLKIDFIGYHERKSTRFAIRPDNPNHDIGTFILPPDQTLLAEAEIVADRKFMQSSFDKKIYNVTQLISSESGSASEILESIPSVQVDIDGNISLRGSGNVTILIDGKPSGLTGFDRAAILEQIPASSIEKIEVITNPSAKYDPDGMAGILNVVLKKDKQQGFNGSVSAGYTGNYNYDKLWNGANGAASLNYRSGKLNVYGNYGYRGNDSWRIGTSFRESQLNDTVPFLDQNTFSSRQRGGHVFKGGMDYDFNDFNNLSLSGNFSIRNSLSNQSTSFRELDPQRNLQRFYVRTSDQDDQSSSYDIGLIHTKTFRKPGQELIVQGNYSKGSGVDFTDINQNDLNEDSTLVGSSPFAQTNLSNRWNQIITLQADFTRPVKETGKFETGYKSILRDINDDFTSTTLDSVSGEFVSDSLLNNNFLYKEYVHAVYATYGNEWKKWKYQLGLRAEMVEMESKLVTTGESFSNPYTSLFPSGNLAYAFTEKTELQASYSRRIHRPSTRSVNPFTDFSDPANIKVGNPFLKPEYINSYELGLSTYNRKTTFTSSLFFKETNDVITRLRTVDSSGIGILSYYNISKSYNYGLELVYITSPTKWLNLNSSATFTQNILDGSNVDADLNMEGITYFARLMATFKISRQLSAQVSGKYYSGFVSLQGTSGPFTSADLMAKYSFWGNSASLSMRIRDVFNTRQFVFESTGIGFSQDMFHKRMSRTFNLTFSYRFGKLEDKRKRRRGDNPGGDGDGSMEDFDM